jgi:LAGLIDADG DNA endonuclease family protein
MKVARTVLRGGKPERAYLSRVVLANASLDTVFHDSKNEKFLKLEDNERVDPLCMGARFLKKDYIEQFWVGLLEGDGSIHVKRNRQNLVYPAFEITLKYLNENENMLKLISENIGGNIYYVKKNKSIFQIRWAAYYSKDVKNCLRILSKYPLLTSRKICQLEYLLKCIEEKSWDYHLITRDKKYDYQMELVNSQNKNLVLLPYFKG